jgi:hypothetical protein
MLFSQAKPRFPHGYNRDGSYDSICGVCFITIGRVKDAHELAQSEAGHVCSPIRLHQFGRYPLLAGTHFDLLR